MEKNIDWQNLGFGYIKTDYRCYKFFEKSRSNGVVQKNYSYFEKYV